MNMYAYGFVMGDHFKSSLHAKTHCQPRYKNLAFMIYNKNQLNVNPASESSTSFWKTKYAFLPLTFSPTHPKAREFCPQIYSLSLTLTWSQFWHIWASKKICGTYDNQAGIFLSDKFGVILCHALLGLLAW